MDVTKLFEISFDPADKIEPLPELKLEAMIDRAVAHPQYRKPANQNQSWIRRAMAVAAVLVIAVTVSFQYMPATMRDISTDTATSSNDAYGDVSDLLMLETLNDLS